MSQILDEKLAGMTPEKQRLWSLRHTSEHVLHTAMQNLYPELKKAMGPAIEEGFYFDFDLAQKISEEDFPAIEAEMKRLIDADLPMVQEFIDASEAEKLFRNNPYKLEWIDEIRKRGEKISVFKMGNVDLDLCSGPHSPSTGEIKAFKLLKVSGAYWHGDEKNKMLARIYGTSFFSQKDLDDYLLRLNQAEKRDHRKIGKELDLFSFSDLVGSGFPLYSQKGALVRRLLNEYVESLQTEKGYQQVWTPQIAKAELFKISGHYDKYKDNMFNVISHYSDEEYFLKPMNCPQHTQLFAARPRSYKDLPLRLTDFAMLYRDEKAGELSGLARVRSFSQDDCHIFAREDQVDEEIDTALSMTKKIMDTFGFSYRYRLSTRDPNHPEKYLGDPKIWDKVEDWAVKIMERNHIDYFPGVGEAAFYAPKMDLMATDALGREWQLSTVQIDFVMPERFDLSYIDSDGSSKRPVMIHRAILGSVERFMMIILEHYSGALPLWLSPVQVKTIPISERHLDLANKINTALEENGIRAQIDDRSETMQSKIRDAQLMKVPYMVILGDKEKDSGQVSVRLRTGENLGSMSIEALLSRIKNAIASRSLL